MSEHRFRFRRGDLELELAGDRDFIQAQLDRWLGVLLNAAPETAPAPAEPTRPAVEEFHRVPKDFVPMVTLSLADLVRMKEATSPVDLVTVAGYYMEKYRRQERYKPEELQAELATLPEWACQTIDEPFELAVTGGYLEPLRDGWYTLTYKGQTYVQNGLSV